MSPPWLLTISREMYRPSPRLPLDWSLLSFSVCKPRLSGSNIKSNVDCSNAGPLLLTSNHTAASSAAKVTRTGDLDVPYLSAFETKLEHLLQTRTIPYAASLP